MPQRWKLQSTEGLTCHDTTVQLEVDTVAVAHLNPGPPPYGSYEVKLSIIQTASTIVRFPGPVWCVAGLWD
jgi:hypothetical protein